MARQFVLQIVYTHGLIQSATAAPIAVDDLPTGIPNANLANDSITVTAGTGLSGGGLVALGGSVTISMPSVGSAGNYNNVNTDAQGRVTSGSLIAYLTSNQTITLTGDVTGSGTTSITTTLAASGVAAATYGDSIHVPQIAVDAKGRITSASNVAIASASLVVDSTVITGGKQGNVLIDKGGTLGENPSNLHALYYGGGLR